MPGELPPHDDPRRSGTPATAAHDPADDTSSYLVEDSSEPAAPAGVETLPDVLKHHPQFRVLRVLGQGGMGIVYLAEHRMMHRLVALKLIQSRLLENPGTLERYKREIKVAGELDHRNVVRALHAEQHGNLHLLVMEYVEGKDLGWVLRKFGRLPVGHACHYARQAALGLQHAHEAARLVHRDIKPSNLMLTPKGVVKVLDFGLARTSREEKPRSAAKAAGGKFLGTATYVSPEQARDASSADARSDIYSLGCTLYHLIAGRPPFKGQGASTLVAHLQETARPLHQVRKGVPEELADLVARMMEKDPEQRIQSAAEVAQLLLPFSRTKPVSREALTQGSGGHVPLPTEPDIPESPTPPPARRLRLVVGLLVAAVTLGLGLGVAAMVMQRDPVEDPPPPPVMVAGPKEKEKPPTPAPEPKPEPPPVVVPGTLGPPAGREIEVVANVSGATITLDGKPQAERSRGPDAPVRFEIPLDPSGRPVEVKVELEGYETVVAKADRDSDAPVRVTLKRVATPEPPKPVVLGKLLLRVKPAGTRVLIDGARQAGRVVQGATVVEVELPVGKHKLRLERDRTGEYREEEIAVAGTTPLNLRRVVLADEKPQERDFYAGGVAGVWRTMLDSGRKQLVPVEDMSSEGREAFGPYSWYQRKDKRGAFFRREEAVIKTLRPGYWLENPEVTHTGRRLFAKLVPPAKVTDDQKQPWVTLRTPGVQSDQGRDLLAANLQWDAAKKHSLRPLPQLVLPNKRTSLTEQVVFPAGVSARTRGVWGRAERHFRLEEANADLPSSMYPVAVGENGSVVFSYKVDGRLWLAASDCLPYEPGKVGPATGYQAPRLLVELTYNGETVYNRPTLSRDRTWLMCPDQAPMKDGLPVAGAKTVVMTLPKDVRQAILEILDENP